MMMANNLTSTASTTGQPQQQTKDNLDSEEEEGEDQEEINFDQLLGDAAQENASFDSDRDDDLYDFDEQSTLDDTLNYTKTMKPLN